MFKPSKYHRLQGLASLFVLSILCLESFSKQIEVCADCSVKTVQVGIDLADTNDVVLLKAGVYKEFEIKVEKPITLQGEEGAVIDGEQRGELMSVTADNVTITGIHFKNVGVSYTKDHAALKVHRADSFAIENCIFEGIFFGLLIEKSHHGIIRNNLISSNGTGEENSGNGIHVWHCSNIQISQNEVYNVRDGIYLEFVTESNIVGNYSHGNFRYGLHFMFSNDDVYTDNVFEDNGAGVAVMFSKFIVMERNRFVKNWGTASYGLLLKEIYDAEIINNRFEENTIAINVEGSTRVNYIHNTLEGNGWAIKIAGACYANIFEENNFLSNAFDVSYNSQMNDNEFRSNYWSEYTGYDLDHNGVGDIPYRPVKLFSYIVNRTPESIVLLRSLFVDIINFSEKVSPVFTPDELVDGSPLMSRFE